MGIAARLQHFSAADRRSARRRKLSLDSNLQGTGDAVTIHDFSSTGMLIETAAELAPFDGLHVDLPEVGATHAVVVWHSGRFYGCQFTKHLSQAAMSAALLRSPPTKIDVLVEEPPVKTRAFPVRGVGASQTGESDNTEDDEKAPLSVRLRVILGSSLLLWALIIWAVRSLVKAL